MTNKAQLNDLRILIIDDNPDDRILAMREIAKVLPDARVLQIGEADELDSFLASGEEVDVVVTDYLLQWSNGLDVFRRLRQHWPTLPIIMFTDSGNEEVAVQALKEGVSDYVTKTPRHYGRVPYAIRAAAAMAQQRRDAEAATEALRHGEALLRLALEAASMRAWEFEAELSEFILQSAHDSAASQSRKVSLGQFLEMLHPEDAAKQRERLMTALSDALHLDEEFRVRHANGQIRWYRAAGMPAGNKRVVGVLEDITTRKELLEQLKEADRRKDQFIATLGHELRSPIAPIGYAVRLITQQRSNEAIDRGVAIIERQVAALGRLLDQLLDLSRITHGRIELSRASVELGWLAREALDDVRSIPQAQDVAFDFTTPSEPLHVVGDELRLRQVFGNLLHNAVRFGGEAKRISFSVRREGDTALVEVADQGIGIPVEMLEKVFEPLVQVQSGPSAQVAGGLGIGLAVARQLVELHGGKISAHSAGPGQGAKFEVCLPLSEEFIKQPEVAGAPQPTAKRVIIADDQPDAAESLGQVLELMGYDVRTAMDGLQAQAVAGEWQPDAMLLDIGMPGLAGDEVARWVRRQVWGARVLLVALTGWGRDEDRRRLMEAGFDAHLVKPAALDDIVAALNAGAASSSRRS